MVWYGGADGDRGEETSGDGGDADVDVVRP